MASPLEPGEPRGALDLDDDEFDEEEEFQEPQENADEYVVSSLAQHDQDLTLEPFSRPLMERSFRSRKSSMGKRSLPQRNSTSKASTSSAPGKPAAAPKPKPGPAEPRKKSLTMPKEFKFQTDLRAHPMSLRGQSHPGPKAGGGVQKKTKPGKQSNKKSSQKVTLTVPEPFQFRTAIKAMVREAPPPKSPFVPLAVQVKQFEATSPPADRRKARPRNVKIASPKLTAARSPRLLTKLRTKPAIPTSEERELAELGIKPKSNTITKRSGPRGPTIPKSPALHKSRPVAPQPPSPPRVIRANPIPEYQKFEPHLPHRATKPVDFELPGEEISRRKREQLEEQRRREEAEIRRMRHFVAQPIPDTLDQPSLPSNVGSHERPLTFPEPFQLSTDLRGETHQRRLQEQLEQERRDKENKARFKAQPFREVEPFIPSKTAKAPTEPVRVMLRSETRAEERRRFEEDLKEKERIAEELRQRQLKEQEVGFFLVEQLDCRPECFSWDCRRGKKKRSASCASKRCTKQHQFAAMLRS